VFALVFEVDGYFRDAIGGDGERKNPWPSRMKDLTPLPRLAELALPPRETVSADKAALLPPKPE
jgi:hypothetical protein